jgi:hypothetical protein
MLIIAAPFTFPVDTTKAFRGLHGHCSRCADGDIFSTPPPPIKNFEGWQSTQMVEHLPSKCKVMGSNSSASGKKKKI